MLFLLIFWCISRLIICRFELGCIRACQRVHRACTRMSGIHGAKASRILAVNWSDQMWKFDYPICCKLQASWLPYHTESSISKPELPDVLHDLNFEIRPGEKVVDTVLTSKNYTVLISLFPKVGILGRTGSGTWWMLHTWKLVFKSWDTGKSTLAFSFFRFVEPTKGRILVDGLDISTVGLTDLRTRLTIIPRQFLLHHLRGTHWCFVQRILLSWVVVCDQLWMFSASTRITKSWVVQSCSLLTLPDLSSVWGPSSRAFDSSRRHGRRGCWNRERQCVPQFGFAGIWRRWQFLHRVWSAPRVDLKNNLTVTVSEKQLLCMARAILKRSKVLVMDEATAR